ncbi:FAD-dependent oxidoreductase [Nonomuraea ferruginea]
MVASVEEGGVALVGGGFVDAHVVVTGIGVRPAVEWLADADLDLHNGVVTDEHLRTSLPNVVAVGDCAAWWSRRFGTRLRVEHWDTALGAPEVAAATLLGEEAVYDPVPYFWSEQFGHMVQYASHHPAERAAGLPGRGDGQVVGLLARRRRHSRRGAGRRPAARSRAGGAGSSRRATGSTRNAW